LRFSAKRFKIGAPAVKSGGIVIAKLISATVFFGGTIALATAATPQCLKPNEIEAEQAIRFQAELMVVSDTCGAQTYTHFTRRNHEALKEYQQQVIERFRRTGGPHPEARFDSYLTRLANEVSLRNGAQPVDQVCHAAASFLATADKLEHESFRRYVAARAAEKSAEYRRCSN
jgi:hypothetical protein